MSLPCRLVSLTVLAVALVSAAMPAAAQQGHGRDERTPPEPKRSNRGQVLSAERMQYDGRDVTRIKVVDDEGRVRIYMDDAPSAPDQRRQPPRNDDNPLRQD
jgi:hypothetical protein